MVSLRSAGSASSTALGNFCEKEIEKEEASLGKDFCEKEIVKEEASLGKNFCEKEIEKEASQGKDFCEKEAEKEEASPEKKSLSRKRSLASLLLSSPRSPDREAYYQEQPVCKCQEKNKIKGHPCQGKPNPPQPGHLIFFLVEFLLSKLALRDRFLYQELEADLQGF